MSAAQTFFCWLLILDFYCMAVLKETERGGVERRDVFRFSWLLWLLD